MTKIEHNPAPVPVTATKPIYLSADLLKLRAGCEGKPITVGQLEKALKGRGPSVLLVLLALPFCFIPIPGVATPFGVAIFLMGFRLALGQKPRLPGFVRRKTLTPQRLAKLLDGGIRFVSLMEKWVRPRMGFLQHWPGMMNLAGLSIAFGGLLLTLPMPIPFHNMLAAWAVVFLALGMMERDGLLVLLGHFLTLLSLALVCLFWLLGVEGAKSLLAHFRP